MRLIGRAPRILAPAPLDPALRLEAAEDAADIAGVEAQLRLQLRRQRRLAIGDLVEQPRLGERQVAVHIMRIERAGEAGVEAVEGADGGDRIGHGRKMRAIS